jgi:hypothetical protein
MVFFKKSNFRPKSIGGYDFSENNHSMAKTNWKSVFLGRDPHIMDRLYLMVPYMSFYGF